MNCKNCTDYMCGGQGTDFENPYCGGGVKSKPKESDAPMVASEKQNIDPSLIKPYMSAQALEYVESLEKAIADLKHNGFCESCGIKSCAVRSADVHVCKDWDWRKDVSL